MTAKKPGLHANIHAKQERIANGSDEHIDKSGSKEVPRDNDFKKAAKTEKKRQLKPVPKALFNQSCIALKLRISCVIKQPHTGVCNDCGGLT